MEVIQGTPAAKPPRLFAARDGSPVLRSSDELQPFSRCVGDWLVHWAGMTPDAVFLAEREGWRWRSVTYAAAYERVRRVAASLVDPALGVNKAQPVVTLADNGIEHGIFILGAMHAGLAVAPVAPAYVANAGKLRSVLELLQPCLVFADNGLKVHAALKSTGGADARIVYRNDPPPQGHGFSFAEFTANTGDAGVDAAFAAVTPDTVGKIIMTSGSTGIPKGVINTHRMMCSNQQAFAQLYTFYNESPPVQLSWLPWNHTAGGNHAFHLALSHGGALYIDGGRPVPGQFEQTVANLRQVSPTSYANVPAAYAMLLPQLEADRHLRESFFGQLRLLTFAGAGMPRELWLRLQQLARQTVGHEIIFGANWGMTETAPSVTCLSVPSSVPGNVGLPLAGCEVKLAPVNGALELRVRGPNVTPGYWRRPDLTEAAFDDEGFLRTGDAGKFVDPDRPELGLVYDGRIAEDFKLQSGTWVRVGALREKILAGTEPVVHDVVIVGENRAEIGLLVFLSEERCRSLLKLGPEVPLAEMARDPRVEKWIDDALRRLFPPGTGGSMKAGRFAVQATPPSAANGELTDKGNIRQRAVMNARAEQVDSLYARDGTCERVALPVMGRAR